MLVHTVFFWLRPDLTAERRAEFRKGVESLATIPGVDKVFVGTPAAVPARPVTDRTFDFSLTVLCRDVAAHDAYQDHPIHHAFIARCREDWVRVLVYDAA